MYKLFDRTKLLDLTQIGSNQSAYLAIVCSQRNLNNRLRDHQNCSFCILENLYLLYYIYIYIYLFLYIFFIFYYKCKVFIVGIVPAGLIAITNNISAAVQALSITHVFLLSN